MACRESIEGFHRRGIRPAGINCPLKVGVATANHRQAVRVKIAYSQSAAASSASTSASLYQLLSLPPDASASDVKGAYRQMAMRYHPDVCPPEEKEECSRMFVKVREAYETLSDPLRRQDYDWRLQNQLDLGQSVGNWGINNSPLEAQLAELMKRSKCERESTWGRRMRSRNQQRDADASA